jgi:hypothetical protein
MVSAIQEVALRMCFARRLFLPFVLIVPLATTGHAVTLGLDDARWIAALSPIREINPAWTAVGSCLLAAALILGHSAKFRK